MGVKFAPSKKLNTGDQVTKIKDFRNLSAHLMHEIGLVDDIISKIKTDSKVKKINILIGELEHISADHFEFHFRERTKGTALENVKLSFKKVEARFRCKDCNTEFSPDEGLNGCPNCKSKLSDVTKGAGISIESVEYGKIL